MNYNESEAALRRVPIYLEDSAGEPVPSLAPTGAEVQVSLSGAAFADGDGSVTEVGSGYYYYEATQPESTTESFITLKVVVGGDAAKRYLYSVDIGDRVELGQTDAARRRIPIYMIDTAGDPVTGLSLTVQLSHNGAAWATGAGAAVETGHGAYYYELTEDEVATPGVSAIKATDSSARPYVYVWNVITATEIAGGATDGGASRTRILSTKSRPQVPPWRQVDGPAGAMLQEVRRYLSEVQDRSHLWGNHVEVTFSAADTSVRVDTGLGGPAEGYRLEGATVAMQVFDGTPPDGDPTPERGIIWLQASAAGTARIFIY